MHMCTQNVNLYIYIYIWAFRKIVVPVPQNGWFIRENPIRIDELGVPLYLETPMYVYTSSISELD